MLKENIELGEECLGTIKFVHQNHWLVKISLMQNMHSPVSLSYGG